MRSVKTFTTLATSTFALLFSVSLVFGDVVWTANIASSPDPAVVCYGSSTDFWLEDEQFDITGLPDHESWTHGDQTTEYRWTVNGGAVEGNGSSATISSGNNGDVGAGKHSISFEGKTGYFICWTDEENNQQSDGPYQVGWLSLGSKGFTVVKVASVSCSGVTSTTGTPGLAETVHVAIGEAGSTITITATSYPPDSWPSGMPSWSTSNPDGSSSSEQIGSGSTLVYMSTDIAYAMRVSASCGTSNAAIILKVIEVESLELEPDIGEEIDDGDEDPDTRTFVVAAAETGVVTVTATPNPDVADAMLLPASWTLTGGTGDAKLFRTIDRTVPAAHTLICTCGTSKKTTRVIIIKVAFTEEEKKVKWEEDGTYDASSLLTSDSTTNNLTWTITGFPTAAMGTSSGTVTFSDTYKYNSESEGTYTVTATHNVVPSCSDSFTLKVVAYLKVPVVLKRKNISLKNGDDKYGHWWAELNGTESYGWWPDRYVNILDTLTSVPGILNGRYPAPFGGTTTMDPHHGDTAEECIQTYIISHERTIAEVLADVRDFANGYSGTWSWPFGQNCHSFQNSMVNDVNLLKEDELP